MKFGFESPASVRHPPGLWRPMQGKEGSLEVIMMKFGFESPASVRLFLTLATFARIA